VIPTDGFYEWTGSKGHRRPIWFHARDGGLVLLAGLFQEPIDGEPAKKAKSRRLFTILTTKPNRVIEPIHDRMPLVVPRDEVDAWLASTEDTPTAISEDWLIGTAVSPRANSVKNDDAECLRPVEAARSEGQLGIFGT
jgi:putative SOS response-associated peptidase YedK